MPDLSRLFRAELRPDPAPPRHRLRGCALKAARGLVAVMALSSFLALAIYGALTSEKDGLQRVRVRDLRWLRRVTIAGTATTREVEASGSWQETPRWPAVLLGPQERELRREALYLVDLSRKDCDKPLLYVTKRLEEYSALRPGLACEAAIAPATRLCVERLTPLSVVKRP